MRRFFVDKILSEGQKLYLTGDEARHILTVLRMKAGDKFIAINGSGTEHIAKILSADKNGVNLIIEGETPCAAEPSVSVTLFQCIPKAGKPEFIIQKCVELGVYAVQPVHSARCVVKQGKEGRENDAKLTRYNRVALEAAKQSGRGIIPEIKSALALNECDFSDFDLVLIAYEDEREQTLKTVLKANTDLKRIALIIGPEGGFENYETERILKGHKNAKSVSLGKRILRSETAGAAALAMIMYEYEQ